MGAAALPLGVGALTLVLRWWTAATGPTDWDSAQYAAAVARYDVTHGRPQPPGYWLYVEVGRFVHDVSGLGTIRSLVLVSALASAATAGATALAGRDLGGPWVGAAAGAVMATSPFLWFDGSIVATYSFDALAGAVLIDLAWRAKPGNGYGIAAAATFAVAAGFRQSIVESFVLLALIPVVAATRRLWQVAATVGAACAGFALWFVPMALEQPGGAAAWWRATRLEASGAARATSVFDHAPGAGTNLGTFAAYTLVALAPLAVLAVLAVLVLGGRRLVGAPASGRHRRRPDPRPWYQRKVTILAAALVPPMALVALVQFAKGGYLLAYLPAAVIALLLPVATVVRGARTRSTGAWLAVATLGVAAVVVLGAQRFLAGAGVLPDSWANAPGAAASGLWVQQARYQAPYPDTRAAIRVGDASDDGLRALRSHLRAGRDVLVVDSLDGGPDFYRNAGWELPDVRSSLVGPGGVQYNQLDGTLYYATGRSSSAIPVRPGGSVLLVASPALPGLARLTRVGAAVPVALSTPIGSYRAWRLRPGVALLGVPIVSRSGPAPLGSGIS